MRSNVAFVYLFLLTAVLAVDLGEWGNFKEKFGRTYKSAVDEQRRISIFQENMRKIQAHNRDYLEGKTSYYMGVNQFTDLTSEEFVQRLMKNVDISGTPKKMISLSYEADIPESIDWREKRAVTPVLDQGDCGSCYIFGSLAAIESQHFLRTGELITLSQQQILDCDTNNNKCRGGWISNTYEFIRSHGAVFAEEYPAYQASPGNCRANGTLFKGIGYTSIPRNENALKIAVATYGPIAVNVDASNMYTYAGGVFNDEECSRTTTNHVVLVVGYGNEDGQDYWLVKNSWGTSFGTEGYIKMARNKNNQCAIASEPYLPSL